MALPPHEFWRGPRLQSSFQEDTMVLVSDACRGDRLPYFCGKRSFQEVRQPGVFAHRVANRVERHFHGNSKTFGQSLDKDRQVTQVVKLSELVDDLSPRSNGVIQTLLDMIHEWTFGTLKERLVPEVDQVGFQSTLQTEPSDLAIIARAGPKVLVRTRSHVRIHHRGVGGVLLNVTILVGVVGKSSGKTGHVVVPSFNVVECSFTGNAI